MSPSRIRARVCITIIAALALAPAALAKPNIVLVVTDDQRWDTLRFMPTVRNELIGKGVHYRNAFAVNPLCCPARTTILTGKYSHTTGVWGNARAIDGRGGFHAFDDRRTLPVWLDRLGYRTGLMGKYLNGYPRLTGYVPPGWDYFQTVNDPNHYYGFEYKGRQWGELHQTDVLAADAVEFIRASAEEPFFLYFAPKAPHVNRAGGSGFDTDMATRHAGLGAGLTQPTIAVNEPDVRDKPRYIRKRAKTPPALLARLRQEQIETLLSVDEAVGSMLSALEETGELDNTVFVYTSDNGYSWGEHRWTQKSVPYEESLRIPLIIRYDQLGRVGLDGRFALNLDLAETITTLAGRRMATAGRNLFSTSPWRRTFLFEHADRPRVVPSYCGFRSREWKYVQYATGEEELYRIRVDRAERWNQAPLRPNLVQHFRTLVLRSACRPPEFVPLETAGTEAD